VLLFLFEKSFKVGTLVLGFIPPCKRVFKFVHFIYKLVFNSSIHLDLLSCTAFTMKVAMVLVFVGILMYFKLSEAALATTVSRAQKLRFQQALAVEEGKPCKCMNWRSCHGEINSDVPCHPNYIFVCCVIPKQEFHIQDEDQIQVIRLTK